MKSNKLFTVNLISCSDSDYRKPDVIAFFSKENALIYFDVLLDNEKNNSWLKHANPDTLNKAIIDEGYFYLKDGRFETEIYIQEIEIGDYFEEYNITSNFIDIIINAVCDSFKISKTILQSKSRTSEHLFARYAIMDLLSKQDVPIKKIATVINLKTPNAVYAGLKRFDDLFITNREFRNLLKESISIIIEEMNKNNYEFHYKTIRL